MEKTGLTRAKYNIEIARVAHTIHNNFLKLGTFWPMQMCRKEAQKKVEEAHFIVDHRKYEGMREYDYKVERAVELGHSTIFYKGRDISIM
jgi:hypothetical protein